MSNYFFITESDKTFKLGYWILKDQQWSSDNKFAKFFTCSDDQQRNLISGSFNSVFVNDFEYLNLNNYIKVPIETSNHLSFRFVSQLTDYESNLMKLAVEKLLATNVIRETFSPYSSSARPLYLKGNLDISVDYSCLNSFTFDRNYELPNVNAFVYSIKKSNLFSKIVLKDAFHQIGLIEADKHKTAFEYGGKQYEFNTLHLGMKNAPLYLQELMESILRAVDQDVIKVFLGYMLIHTENFDHHLGILKKIFQEFSRANLKIDANESSFLMTDEVYLGFGVSCNGVSISQENLDKIRDLPIPMNTRDVTAFLELIEPFKVFSPDFDQIVLPLKNLTGEESFFRWTWVEQKAFDNVKRSLFHSSPVPFR